MRIKQGIALDFQDVLLVPKRSTIGSRSEINLERTFKFRWSSIEWHGIPVISSNMTSVTTKEVAQKMADHGMLACIPKVVNESWALTDESFILSYGLQEIDQYAAMVCIDVPNGYMESVVRLVKGTRTVYQDQITIIVGNVVTAEMTEALILAGADIVKVGIGSGAACSTRIKTGVGMPQLSAVIECADAAHGLGGHIISDGGCVTTGDIAKAFAAGADFVMLGGMLAGHTENGATCRACEGRVDRYRLDSGTHFICPDCNGTGREVGAFYGMSSERANNEFAGGLKTYRAAEGWEMKLQDRGTIEGTLQDIEGGLRSACSYVGAKNLKDLPKCATFVQVNRQVNTSLWDSRI